LTRFAVILRRCAWHQKYHGYSIVYGVSSWRGLGLSFSEGMCGGGARRWRAKWTAIREGKEPPVPLVPRWLPLTAISVARVAALIRAARPLSSPTPSLSASPTRPTLGLEAPRETGTPPPQLLEMDRPAVERPAARPPRTKAVASASRPDRHRV